MSHLHFESQAITDASPWHVSQFSSSELSAQSTMPSHLIKRHASFIEIEFHSRSSTVWNFRDVHIDLLGDRRPVYFLDICQSYNSFHRHHQYNWRPHLNTRDVLKRNDREIGSFTYHMFVHSFDSMFFRLDTFHIRLRIEKILDHVQSIVHRMIIHHSYLHNPQYDCIVVVD